MRYEFEVTLNPVRFRPAVKPDIRGTRVPPIRRNLVLAYQIADYMKVNRIATLRSFCRSARISSARGTQIMSTLFLSPSIQTQILMGNDPKLFALTDAAMRALFREVFWPRQEDLWQKVLAGVGKETDLKPGSQRKREKPSGTSDSSII